MKIEVAIPCMCCGYRPSAKDARRLGQGCPVSHPRGISSYAKKIKGDRNATAVSVEKKSWGDQTRGSINHGPRVHVSVGFFCSWRNTLFFNFSGFRLL